MPALKIFLISIGGIGALVFIFLIYSGLFSKVEIKEKEMESYILVYDEHIGEYKGTRDVQDRIYDKLLNDEGIETYKGFGVYYDDPKKVAKEELRSIAGCILEKKDYGKIEELKKKGFKIKESEQGEAICAQFPFKSPLSVLLGIIKVYPSMDKYVEEHGIDKKEIMEIYDIPNKKIIYFMKK